jgi:2-methylcitrate dehydratase PrpD
MSSPTLSQQLGTFGSGMSVGSLPLDVRHSVKQRVLDTLGICIAASTQGLAAGVAEVLDARGGREQASLVGRSARFPAALAALYNGTLAHSLDFDDTHLPSVLHPSATIVPASLSVAEACGADGPSLIAAIAVGLEVTIRVGLGGYLADEGNAFFERGWHATSICGTLGAAASAGKLMGLDSDRIADALGIAASMGSGIIEGNRRGGTVKRLHCGWAAHAGITAAELAAHGYTAPSTALEGRFGFYRAFLDGHYNPAAIVSGLGERWEILATHFKPYPANHYTHAAIDAALAIKARRTIRAEEIDRIDLGCAKAALLTIGEPRDDKIRPQSGYHARFSGPFTVATALLGGGGLGVDLSDFTDEAARDPQRLRLAAKVTTFVDAECDRLFPNSFAAVLRVHFADGTTLEERVMDNRGGPKFPLSDAELQLKFSLNVGASMSQADGDAIAAQIFGIETAKDVSELMASLRLVDRSLVASA